MILWTGYTLPWCISIHIYLATLCFIHSYRIYGHVYTVTFSLENAYFSLRMHFAFTRQWWKRMRYRLHFEGAPESGDFWKRWNRNDYLTCVNTENAKTFAWKVLQKMALENVVMLAVLLSSLIGLQQITCGWYHAETLSEFSFKHAENGHENAIKSLPTRFIVPPAFVWPIKVQRIVTARYNREL